MAKRAPEPISVLRSVRDWLPDYFAMSEGTRMEEILADVAKYEVESYAAARSRVNGRIDNWIMWLDGIRPVPCFANEPEAHAAWVAERKLQKRT
jgi:hypothetical protein